MSHDTKPDPTTAPAVLDAKGVKAALIAAGVEVYRTRASEVHVAERVRVHLMDSGISVRCEPDGLRLRFVGRAQRSHAPDEPASALVERVRAALSAAAERGYAERGVECVEVRDPMNDARVLDVWHEVVYERGAPESSDPAWLVDEVRWLLGRERFLGPDGR